LRRGHHIRADEEDKKFGEKQETGGKSCVARPKEYKEWVAASWSGTKLTEGWRVQEVVAASIVR
jgi:hypothetical protein